MYKRKNNWISMKAPPEFAAFIDDLAKKEALQNGDAPSKARVMRLMAQQYKDRIIFKGKKMDFKLF